MAADGVVHKFSPYTQWRNDASAFVALNNATKPGMYIEDALADMAIEFVQRQRAAGAAFFAVVSFFSVHGPFAAPAADVARNAEEIDSFPFDAAVPRLVVDASGIYRTQTRQDHPTYAGMVENLDYNVGRILRSLSEGAAPSAEDDTIVIFTSDNGGLASGSIMPGCGGQSGGPSTSNAPLRAGKGHLYEGGIRVPLFIRWPGALAPRADAGSAVLGMDLLPTALDLVGAPSATPRVDGGRSFAAVLRGTEDWSDRAIFWHSRKPRSFSTGDSAGSALRQGRYKLIHFLGPGLPADPLAPRNTCAPNFGHLELYDLHADPSEAVNLADVEPERARAMLLTLVEWKRARGASDAIPACTLPRNTSCKLMWKCVVCTPERPCHNTSAAACEWEKNRSRSQCRTACHGDGDGGGGALSSLWGLAQAGNGTGSERQAWSSRRRGNRVTWWRDPLVVSPRAKHTDAPWPSNGRPPLL